VRISDYGRLFIRPAANITELTMTLARVASLRLTETTITFRHSFALADLEAAQPPGTYRLVTEEEEIPGLSFVALRRTVTLLHLPALSTSGTHQVVSIAPKQLAAIVEGDRRGYGEFRP
jgi:hypothetical protein